MKKICILATMICLVLTAANAHALSVAYSKSYREMGGYGFSSYSNWTSAVNAAFENNVDKVSNFQNSNKIDGHDAVIVNLRSPSYSLKAKEVANLTSFIASGGRVLLIGENNAWKTWNTSLLSLVGGTYDADEFDGVTTSLLSHPLLAGVGDVSVHSGSSATGGTSLFNNGFANLWGVGNVLTVQDANIFSNEFWGEADNAIFARNVADWLAGSNVATPIPGAAWLLGTGLFGLVGIRRMRRA